jgi:plasmid stabilization system protein ParE
VRLEWSIPGSTDTDREKTFDSIAADGPSAAIERDERIGEPVQRLVRFPESGRPGGMSTVNGAMKSNPQKSSENASQAACR